MGDFLRTMVHRYSNHTLKYYTNVFNSQKNQLRSYTYCP